MGQKRQYTRNAWRLAGGLVAGATLFACGSKPLNCTERQYPSPMTGGCVGLGEYMQQNDGAFPDGYEPEDAALPDAMDSGVAIDSGDSGVLSRSDSSDVIDVIDASTTSDAEAGVDSATCDGGLLLCGATCVDTSTDRLNCGACGNACGPRTGATASCSMSACAYVCNAGFEEVGGGCDVAVARPVFPPGTSTVTMLRPTLKWALPMGVDGAQIELCRDRACTMVIERIDATGTSARPAMDLPRSTVVFWRLRGRVGSTAGTRTSPTWQFRTPARSATTADTAYGTEMDVNGDGFTDVAVGVPGANGGNGAVRFFYGGSGGPSVTTSLEIPGTLGATSRFSRVVVPAGDLNGDGFGDVAVSARAASPGGRADAGVVLVYFGSATGPVVARPDTLEGVGSGDWFGFSVSGAGDVDGDGFGDLAVGSYQSTTDALPGIGEISLLYGRATALSATRRTTLPAAFMVSGAFDANGDQLSDVVVSHLATAAGAAPFAGAAYVLLGQLAGLSTVPQRVLVGQANDNFGSLANAADVNNDGYSDLIVGSPSADYMGIVDAGKVDVFVGSATGISAVSLATIYGSQASDLVGTSVASVGDLNGDGRSDLVVGFPRQNVAALTAAGRVLVFTATASGWSGPTTIDGTTASARFGSQIGNWGDFDGDGRLDVLIAADAMPVGGATNAGAAFVLRGTATGVEPVAFRAYLGRGMNDRLGAAIGRVY